MPSLIARTGVQVYTYSDGRTVREYRPPEEVFAPASLASWPGLALTVEHPSEPITIDNWNRYAVGHVGDNVRKDGTFIAADAVIKDGAAIKSVGAGELVELSCGYYADVDPTPGVTPEGEAYDAIQRNIVGNHVAIGPKGWGRAGEKVKLYASDSAGAIRHDLAVGYHCSAPNESGDIETMSIKTDADKNAAATVSRDEYDRLLAERDALKAQVESVGTAATVAADSKLSARVTLRLAASKIDSSIKVEDSKLTDREIMIAAIKSVRPDFNADGKSDAYVEVAFDMAREQSAKSDAASATATTASNATTIAKIAAPGARADADDGGAAVRAREAMINRNRGVNAGKGN